MQVANEHLLHVATAIYEHPHIAPKLPSGITEFASQVDPNKASAIGPSNRDAI